MAPSIPVRGVSVRYREVHRVRAHAQDHQTLARDDVRRPPPERSQQGREAQDAVVRYSPFPLPGLLPRPGRVTRRAGEWQPDPLQRRSEPRAARDDPRKARASWRHSLSSRRPRPEAGRSRPTEVCALKTSWTVSTASDGESPAGARHLVIALVSLQKSPRRRSWSVDTFS